MLRVLTFIAALGCGVMAGVFYAFSSFVMAGLARAAPTHGLSSMQSINITAVRLPFMALFLGTGLVCGVTAVAAILTSTADLALLLVGSGLYLVGSFGLTIGYHVPRNNALVALDPASPTAADEWSTYVRDWTRWNHVRFLASLGASASYVSALLA